MDFFGAQDQARGRTKTLIGLYLAALLAIIVCIYFAFVIAGFGIQQSGATELGPNQGDIKGKIDFINPSLFVSVAGGVILVIVGASIFKISSLGKGGASIAQSVGGRQVDTSTSDPDERKLINIVEEMSIASGVPMPDVFVLPQEDGINAFAAGYDINDAAIAVTKGAIRQLSRDELQGVVAHEFSHIFSGDMRLNIRLIGPLFGLLVIAFVGRMLLYSGSGRSRGKDQNNLALVGLAIMAIGYIGVIFGRMIQAAISRQREYLADASAVQFTRNPEGIANALRRLGYTPTGSKINNPHAEDTAHMFFAKALGSSLSTHPPLPKRIEAILPNWDGTFLAPRKERLDESNRTKASPKATSSGGGLNMNSAAAMAAVGALSDDHLRQGIERRIRIQQSLGTTKLDKPDQSTATITALMLSSDPESKKRQLSIIAQTQSDELVEEFQAKSNTLQTLSAADQFAVIELCFPGLRKLSASEQRQFNELLRKLAEEDGEISLREALILDVIHRQFQDGQSKARKHNSLENQPEKFAEPISELLYLVAALECKDDATIRDEIQNSISEEYLLSNIVRFPESPPSLRNLTDILESLNRSSFGIRKQVLSAVAKIILSDNKTTDREWTFLRLVSLSMGAPMPPLESSS